MDMNSLKLVEYCAWNWTTSRCWLFKNINFFAFYVNLQTIIHVHYMLLGVEGMAMRMAVREELSLLSGLIIVKLLIQLVREILHLSGKSQRISETTVCGNHVWWEAFTLSVWG